MLFLSAIIKTMNNSKKAIILAAVTAVFITVYMLLATRQDFIYRLSDSCFLAGSCFCMVAFSMQLYNSGFFSFRKYKSQAKSLIEKSGSEQAPEESLPSAEEPEKKKFKLQRMLYVFGAPLLAIAAVLAYM